MISSGARNPIGTEYAFTTRGAREAAAEAVAADRKIRSSAETTGRTLKEQQAAQVRLLREQGLSYTKIAKEMGFSASKARALAQTQVTAAKESTAAINRTEAAMRGQAATSRRTSASVARDHRGILSSWGSMTKRIVGYGAAIGSAYLGFSQAKTAITNTQALAKQTSFLARQTGLEVKAASQWAAVTKVRGIEGKALNTVFATLAKNQGAATRGGITQIAMFRQLGITQSELKDIGNDYNALLGAMADGLRDAESGSGRMEAASRLLGRGFQTLEPLLKGGREELEKTLGAADEMGATFTEKTLPAQLDLVDAQRKLKLAGIGVQLAFTKAITPALLDAADEATHLAQVFNDPNLTPREKFEEFKKSISNLIDPEAIARDVGAAAPGVIREAGELALDFGKSFLNAFVDADIGTKLTVALFAGMKLNGLGALRAVSGGGAAATAAAGGGGLLASLKGKPGFKGVAANAGKAGVIGYAAIEIIPRVVDRLADATDPGNKKSFLEEMAANAQLLIPGFDGVITSAEDLQQAIAQLGSIGTKTAGELGRVFVTDLKRDFQLASDFSKDGVKSLLSEIDRLPPGMREAAEQGAQDMIDNLHRAGVISAKQAERAKVQISNSFSKLATNTKKSTAGVGAGALGMARQISLAGIDSTVSLAKLSKAADKAGGSIGASMKNAAKATRQSILVIERAVNAALSGLGAKEVGLSVGKALVDGGKGEKKARGGWLRGSGRQDTVPIMAAPGEAILNRHQQKPVEHALRSTYGIGLHELFSRERRPHYMAQGGYVQGAIPPTNPATRAFAQKMFARGFNVTNALRNYGGTYHQAGAALDFGDSVNDLRALHKVTAPMSGSFAEYFGPSYVGMSGPGGVLDHEDHIHIVILKAIGQIAGKASGQGAAGAAVAAKLARVLIKGPNGALKDLVQGGADKVHAAANAYLARQTPKAKLAGGAMKGLGKVSGGSPLAIGQRMAASAGWTGGEWSALRELWNRESGWNPRAENPSSGAYGIPQSLPASKMASAGSDWRTNPATQIRWGIGYIKDRYGSPTAALSFHDSHNWYARGGKVKDAGWFGAGGQFVADRPTVFGAGERPGQPELVTVQRMAKGGFSAEAAGFPTGGIKSGSAKEILSTLAQVSLNESGIERLVDKLGKEVNGMLFADLLKLIRRSGKHLKDVNRKMADQYQAAIDSLETTALGKADRRFGRASFKLERLGLQQQLAGTFDDAASGKARGAFITENIVPAIQAQIDAERVALENERRKPKRKKDRDEIEERKARVQELILEKMQAEIDAREANTAAVEEQTDALKEFSGSTSFGFQGQGFTDLINVGVGA